MLELVHFAALQSIVLQDRATANTDSRRTFCVKELCVLDSSWSRMSTPPPLLYERVPSNRGLLVQPIFSLNQEVERRDSCTSERSGGGVLMREAIRSAAFLRA